MAVALVEVEGLRDLESLAVVLQREIGFEVVDRGAYRELRRCANLGLIYNFLRIPHPQRRRGVKLLKRGARNLILLFEGGGKEGALKLLADVVKELHIQRKAFTSLKHISLIVDADADGVNAIASKLASLLRSKVGANVSGPSIVGWYGVIEVEGLPSMDVIVVQPSLEGLLNDLSAPRDVDALTKWLSESGNYEAFKAELLRRSGLRRLLTSLAPVD